MADDTAPAPESAGAVVAELAATATTAAAEATAAVEHIAEETAEAVADIQEEVQDEVAWLKSELAEHKTAIAGIAETLSNLPATLSEALTSSVRTALMELSPRASGEPASPAAMQESHVAPATLEAAQETPAAPKPKGIHYL